MRDREWRRQSSRFVSADLLAGKDEEVPEHGQVLSVCGVPIDAGEETPDQLVHSPLAHILVAFSP
jgi:hypothetical protein